MCETKEPGESIATSAVRNMNLRRSQTNSPAFSLYGLSSVFIPYRDRISGQVDGAMTASIQQFTQSFKHKPSHPIRQEDPRDIDIGVAQKYCMTAIVSTLNAGRFRALRPTSGLDFFQLW